MLKTFLLALFSIQGALTSEAPSDQLRYESKTAGYSIMLPKAWRATADKKIYTQDGRPILVDFWANEPDKHISLEIIVNHAVGEEQAFSTTEPNLKHVSQFLDNYKVEESSETTVDGIPAMHHIISYTDTIELAKVQYVVTSNRQIYEITFTTPKASLEQNRSDMEQIIQTIHFNKNEK